MILRHLAPHEAIAYLSGEGREGLASILDYEPLYSDGYVAQEVLAGRLELRMVEADKARGLLLTFIDARNPARSVLYVWGLAMSGKGWHGAMQHALKELARAKGCGSVQARSCRRGWNRFATRFGWKPTEWELAL